MGITTKRYKADEWLKLQQAKRKTAHRNDEEHRIQVKCIDWFYKESPYHSLPLFAVPNGGRRDAVTAAKLKAEGVVAGVADLILLVKTADYGSLCIEMKTYKGRQRESQKQWQKKAEANGNKYVVCRSLEQFKQIIKEYLHNG